MSYFQIHKNYKGYEVTVGADGYFQAWPVGSNEQIKDPDRLSYTTSKKEILERVDKRVQDEEKAARAITNVPVWVMKRDHSWVMLSVKGVNRNNGKTLFEKNKLGHLGKSISRNDYKPDQVYAHGTITPKELDRLTQIYTELDALNKELRQLSKNQIGLPHSAYSSGRISVDRANQYVKDWLEKVAKAKEKA